MGEELGVTLNDSLIQGTALSWGVYRFLVGAIDGIVTTFAIVSGVAGAGLSSGIVIVLGIANLLGDGFSMGVSDYLGTRAEDQQRQQARSLEEHHIAVLPEGETEEVVWRRC